MLSATYRDRWQHDRAGVVAHSREVLGHFATLTILREPRGLRAESGTWFLSEKIVLRGFGDPLAMAAREAVGALHGPFVMEWRPRTWKPWDWELQSVIQPELDVP